MRPITTKAEFQTLTQASLQHPEKFWAEQAKNILSWHQPWKKVLTGDFAHNNVRWFEGGQLNVCYNCLDRHLPDRARQTALVWESDDPAYSKTFSYQELFEHVCRLANGLKSLGIKKGDRVCIYMPMVPEAAMAMLACARIGAVHSVVFAGFSAESLKNRINDAQCSVIITAEKSVRGGKTHPLRAQVNAIIRECPSIKHSIVLGAKKLLQHEMSYQALIDQSSINCPIEIMEATDPLFILYTSGSTGKPKGILHGQGGYLLYATLTFQVVFAYQTGDIYWCTADIGWITGHSYVIYGPLASGATTLMFAGVPTWPYASRYWQIIDKHHVNIFYTAPTAIRALMRLGDTPVKRTSRQSLNLLGTVGEPINPEAWQWYYNVVGEGRCPIVDTWWQTETGGIMISPIPYVTKLKPASVTKPFLGVSAAILDDQGQQLEKNQTGNLVITKPWPGQFQTIYGDPERAEKTYFSQFPGYYCAGDAAFQDEDGYFWIVGRSDDVMNVSGHRLDTAEIESALNAHPDIAEAAVVGFPHHIKGQGIYAFVTPNENILPDQHLFDALIECVRKKIGPFATPDEIRWTPDLPKTRSGKILRRILRKIASQETDDLGDLSTLANPEIVEQLKSHANQL